jgi:proline-rich tail region repeat protein
MYYGITFDKGNGNNNVKNTWSDWYLVPSSRPSVAPPEPKMTIVEIPGSNGVIDLTESLTGDITYGNRKGSWEFIVMNEKPILWSNLYSDILDFLHGQKVKIFMETELDSVYPSDWYYEGRISVKAWDTQDNYSVISMDYDLDPFKYERVAFSRTMTLTSAFNDNWLTNTVVNAHVFRQPVIPKFNVASGASNVQVWFKGHAYDLIPGEEQAVANIIFTQENSNANEIKLKGSGSVTVTFRGGRL